MRTHYTDPAPMSPADDPEPPRKAAPLGPPPDYREAARANRRIALVALRNWESQIESDYAGTRMYDGNMADVKALRDQLLEV